MLRLREDNFDMNGITKHLPEKGYRLDAKLFLVQDNDADVWRDEVATSTD